MAKNTRFPISRQLNERLLAAVKYVPRASAHIASPERRGDQNKLPQSAAGLGRSAQPVPQKKPVLGKKGGGRKPIFTPEEKIRLQGIYRELLGEDSKFKKYSLAEPRMRRLLPKDKKGVSLRTLKRDVFWPVLGKRTK
jgi:hypothetical protein